jgi:hypothetical protein
MISVHPPTNYSQTHPTQILKQHADLRAATICEVVTPLTRIFNVPGSNVSWDTYYP